MNYQDYKFVTDWLGTERDIKSLLFEIADLQLALTQENRRKNAEMCLATITAIITRLSNVYSEEDTIKSMAKKINEMDYDLCYDKCRDMVKDKDYA